MYLDRGEGGGNLIEAHSISTAWEEGIEEGHAGVSNWDEATSTNTWTIPGGDFNATTAGTMSTDAKGYQAMTLSPALVQAWLDNPSNNFGLILLSTGGDVNKHIEFISFDGAADKKPYLEIVLGCGGGNPDSDGDGILDEVEDANQNGQLDVGESDPNNACDPDPANGNCAGADGDEDGYFSNYPTNHAQYDPDDMNQCIPDDSGGNSTITITQGIDTYLKEKSMNRAENYGKKDKIHHKATANEAERGLIQFDLTGHAGNTVTSATLYMYLDRGEGGGNLIEAHSISTAWEEGIEEGHAGVSNWDEATSTNTWTIPGGDFNATTAGTMSTDAKGYQAMTLSPALVQAWLDNPSNNFGLILLSTGGDVNKHIEFISFDGAADKKPYLEIVLGCGGGNPDSDGDGILDEVEDANQNGQLDVGESDPNNACDPDPANGNCAGVDGDGDGYFANYSTNHAQYDPDDADENNPVPTNNNGGPCSGAGTIVESSGGGDGVDSPENALGSFDGMYTTLNADGSEFIIIDLGVIIPQGDDLVIGMCRISGAGNSNGGGLKVTASYDLDFGDDPTNSEISLSDCNTLDNRIYTISQGTGVRYIKLEAFHTTGDVIQWNFNLDGIEYDCNGN